MELGTNSKRLAKEYRERESDHKRKWLLFYFLGLNFINEIILGEHTYFWEWYLKLRNGRGGIQRLSQEILRPWGLN